MTIQSNAYVSIETITKSIHGIGMTIVHSMTFKAVFEPYNNDFEPHEKNPTITITSGSMPMDMRLMANNGVYKIQFKNIGYNETIEYGISQNAFEELSKLGIRTEIGKE